MDKVPIEVKLGRFNGGKLATMFKEIEEHASSLGLTLVSGGQLFDYSGIGAFYGQCRVTGRVDNGQVVQIGYASFSMRENYARYKKADISLDDISEINNSEKSALLWYKG